MVTALVVMKRNDMEREVMKSDGRWRDAFCKSYSHFRGHFTKVISPGKSSQSQYEASAPIPFSPSSSWQDVHAWLY